MEALAIGDLHFDGPISKLVEHHERIIVDELNSVVKVARNKGIKNLFLLGDTGHTPRISYECQIAFLDWLRSVKDMAVHCILGNHDMFSDDPEAGHSLQLVERVAPKNFHLYTTPTNVNIDGTKVRFLPWPSTDFKRHCLNIAHIERKGTHSDNGRAFRGNLSDGNEVAIIGHLHTPQKVRRSYYPGTLYQTNFGQSSDKRYAYVSYDSDNDFEVNLVRHNPSLVLRTVELTNKADVSKLKAKSGEIVRVVLKDGFSADSVDLGKYKNVVKVTGETEIQTNNLSDGIDMTISTEEFLNAFLQTQNVNNKTKRRALQIWSTL